MSSKKRSLSTKLKDIPKDSLDNGFEGQVTINTRMFIDKALARYSSDFIICRELIQNADDAHATWFHFEITCCPLKDLKDFQSSQGNHPVRHRSTQFISEISNAFRIFKPNTQMSPLSEGSHASNNVSSERDFHNYCITEIRANNNGRVFNETDWERVMSIAEGNTDVDAVGQFGVGFFSVFSLCEEPIIISGNEYMVFMWENDVLSTVRHEMSDEQQNQSTTIILTLKNYYKLLTDPTLTAGNQYKSNKKMSDIEPKIDLTELKTYFTKASVHIDDSFHQEIRQILKKDLPTTVRITLLFTPNTIIEQQLQSSVNEDINAKILKSLIPLRSNKNEIIPSGYVFIGLGTHQSTGIGMHVFSHFIPTIERENLDLENPHISKWNQELLLSTGQIARFIYDQTMNRNSFINNKQEAYRFISSYSFEPSVPNNKIGDAILSGFFHTTHELFVSVQQSPSNSEVCSISSKQAYLAHSPDIYTFLTLPLVPYNLVRTKFFKHLERLKLIAVVNHTIIEKTISDTVLLLEEFINLVRWLCKNKTSLQHIFSSITYRENITSSKISLKNIQYYINKNMISSILPLPSNILPINVSIRFSSNELEENLSLSKYNSRQLVDFYLLDNQHYLLRNADTSLQVLNLICQQSNQFRDSEWHSVKSILSSIKCIPTTQGMKIPNQSYILSTIPLLPEVPKITINLANDDQNSKKINKTYQQSTDASSDFVSKEFLKQIGCCTFHLQSFIAARHASSDERIERLIQELIEERSNMTDIEFEALKQTEWLRGTTNIYYIPRQLCFPSVVIELNWPTLLVIDWPDIKSTSQQYLFLKQLGVREVPDLSLLI
ncbi:unnamed protein product, partial [Adineta steineri]